MRLILLDSFNNPFNGNVPTEVDYVVAVVLQYRLDDIFAYIVYVALYRSKHHFGSLADVTTADTSLDDVAHRRSHFCGRYQLWQKYHALFVSVAYLTQSRYYVLVYYIQAVEPICEHCLYSFDGSSF